MSLSNLCFSFKEFKTLLPEGIIVATLLFLCTVYFFSGVKEGSKKTHFFIPIALIGLLIAVFSLFSDYHEGAFLAGMVYLNSFIFLAKGFLVILTFAILGLSLFMKTLRSLLTFEYIFLILSSLLGGLLALSSNHFLMLFVSLELQVLPLYLLMALPKRTTQAFESALKYFVLGGLSTGFLLLGISFVYGSCGILSFHELEKWLFMHTQQGLSLLSHAPYFMIGLVFILGALGFKLSLVPFHAWTPDIYEGTETHTTLFLATISKMTAVCVMIRLFWGVFLPASSFIYHILLWVAVVSMLWGTFGALAQTNLKRLLGYSTISHMGYVLSAVLMLNESGFYTALFYLLCYMPSVFLVFALLIYEQEGSKEPLTLYELKHKFKHASLSGGLMVMGIFSLAGLPPFPVFFGKIFLLLALLEQKAWLLIATLLISSLIACYYYLRILRILYFDRDEVRV